MKKVLIFAYYYPPMGGAGVQRTAKFVKYLPDFRYIPVVACGLNKVNSRHVPGEDETLVSDVKGTKVYRTEITAGAHLKRRLFSNVFGRLIPGLASSWWHGPAVQMMEKAIQAERPDLILVSVSPFDAGWVCAKIARRWGVPWVLDMRDPWALDPVSYYRSWLHYRLDLRRMKETCLLADAVIMNTPESYDALRSAFPMLSQKKLFCITNGWDADDFEALDCVGSAKMEDPLKIVHTGNFQTEFAIIVDQHARATLKKGYWKIRDTIRYSPVKSNLLSRSPYYLFKAIRRLIDDGKLKNNDVRLFLVGTENKLDKELAGQFGLGEIVQFTGYVSHTGSVKLLAEADVLFLPLHEPVKGKSPLIVPGKTYEYMATRKPILALVPRGDARDFVRESGLGFVCEPTDVGQIAQTLLELVGLHRSNKLAVKPNEQFIRQFERRILTEKLSKVFDFVLDGKGAGCYATGSSNQLNS